jgi:hypothetical protein
VLLVVDCCQAGGFVQQCTASTDTKRIVIASTTPDAPAVFSSPQGSDSFTFDFLSYAILGNTIFDCFRWTRLSFGARRCPWGQVPWLDDNGDGVFDKRDGQLADRAVFGRYPAFGMVAPTIREIGTPLGVEPASTATLWADLGQAVPAVEAWAVVVPEQGTYDPSVPVSDLARIELAPGTLGHIWEGTWTVPPAQGYYVATFFAVGEDSLGTRLLASPVATRIMVGAPTAVRTPWQLLP